MLTLLNYLAAAAAGAAIAGFTVFRRSRVSRLAAQRVARMFAALSDTNEAIMRVTTPEELYQRVCEAAVHGGRLLAATLCVPREHSTDVQIIAVAGAGANPS